MDLITAIRTFCFDLYTCLYQRMDLRLSGCTFDWDITTSQDDDGEDVETIIVYFCFPGIAKTAKYSVSIDEFTAEYDPDDMDSRCHCTAEAFDMIMESIQDAKLVDAYKDDEDDDDSI